MHPKRKSQPVIQCEWTLKMKDAAERAVMREMVAIRDQMKQTLVAGLVAPVLAQQKADAALRQAMNFLAV